MKNTIVANIVDDIFMAYESKIWPVSVANAIVLESEIKLILDNFEEDISEEQIHYWERRVSEYFSKALAKEQKYA